MNAMRSPSVSSVRVVAQIVAELLEAGPLGVTGTAVGSVCRCNCTCVTSHNTTHPTADVRHVVYATPNIDTSVGNVMRR